MPDYGKFYDAKTGDYAFTASEREDLLRRLNKENADAWIEQLEARRRWSKLEDYVAGRQVYDEVNGRFVGHEIAGSRSASSDVDDETFIFNLIRRIHLSNVQRLSSYSIYPVVVPNSSDPRDKTGARLGRIALADLFNKIGEKKLKRRIATIIGKYGSCFLKTHFDPSLGRLIHPIKMDEFGEAYIDKTEVVPEGQVIIEAFSPRNVLLPRYCRQIEDADWLEEIHIETTDWIWRKFGVKVEPEPIMAKTWLEPQAIDTDMRDVEWQLNMPKNGVVVKGRYIRPCPEFARGAIIFYTNKHVLRCTDLLTYYDDIPFTMARAIEDEKSAFGDSWLWDIIPVQDALNNDLSAMVNHVKVYGDQQWQVPATANLKLDNATNATGKIYTYTGDKGMEPVQSTELHQSHFQILNTLHSFGQSLGAAQDITRSNKVLSGNALATLQQMDDTVLRPVLEDVGEAIEGACEQALKLMAEYYTNERLIKMTGMQGWEIKDGFVGEMLNNNFDVQVRLMTGLSNNPQVRQESVLKALQAQIISPQQAANYLEMGDSDKMLEDIQKENEIVDRRIRDITDVNNYTINPMTGEKKCTVIAHAWDNHALMVEKLITYMRENYDHQPPEVQKELDFMLQFHKQALAPPPMMPGAPGAQPGMPPMPQGAPTPSGLPDSVQNPADQPPAGSIPSPAATGMTQIPGNP